jgi:magnesium chelatase family protein
MQVKTFGCALECLNATTITIELCISKGHQRIISGLPDDTVKESLARIESAIGQSGYELAEAKMVFNLYPASIPKTGIWLDLPMAVAILAASGHIFSKDKIHQFMICGEICLDGSVQPVSGALSIALQAWKDKFAGLIVPLANVQEAAMITKVPVFGVSTLKEAVQFLNGQKEIQPVKINTRELFQSSQLEFDTDYSEVVGQRFATRAMEICAAGSHNAILIGPPGSGKSMIAQRLSTILPPLTLAEALDVTRIYSICGETDKSRKGLISKRPFVSSHYSTSIPGLIGGGTIPMPGLITKAHNGVLFLDELAEYSRAAIESIRLPLETGEVKITRAMRTVVFPASFILIAATNPCPCGYFNHERKTCSCSPHAIQKYLNKISGPLLDRIDLHIEVGAVPAGQMAEENEAEGSATIRERVIQARELQTERFKDSENVHCNAQMSPSMIKTYCKLETSASELLVSALQTLQLSCRAHDRILKVSRTIADLQGEEGPIRHRHISEAIGYRGLDKERWIHEAAAKNKSRNTKKHVYKIA